MPIQLTFRSEAELQAFIVKVATPIAKKIARDEAFATLKQRFQFRSKVDKSNSRSAYETVNQFGAGYPAIITGSKSNGSGQIAALNNLLTQLAALGIVTDNTSP